VLDREAIRFYELMDDLMGAFAHGRGGAALMPSEPVSAP
jgi:hypothetical protein